MHSEIFELVQGVYDIGVGSDSSFTVRLGVHHWRLLEPLEIVYDAFLVRISASIA